jgi:hypothetical protein
MREITHRGMNAETLQIAVMLDSSIHCPTPSTRKSRGDVAARTIINLAANNQQLLTVDNLQHPRQKVENSQGNFKCIQLRNICRREA